MTNLFKTEMPPTSEYERGLAKVAQSPAESRDANVPGHRNNPEMAIVNIHKAKPATGRRP